MGAASLAYPVPDIERGIIFESEVIIGGIE
jgi:hypothetical protein